MTKVRCALCGKLRDWEEIIETVLYSPATSWATYILPVCRECAFGFSRKNVVFYPISPSLDK